MSTHSPASLKAPLFALALALVTLTAPAGAQTPAADIQALRAQLLELGRRLDALEQSNRELQASNRDLRAANAAQQERLTVVGEQAAAASSTPAASWADALEWSGDFRYRYETIDVQGRASRDRSRIRARTALTAQLYDDLKVGIGLASGSEDPVSSNQTLGGGGTTKDIGLDLAYFEWSGLPDTRVLGGKFKNVLQPAGGNSMLFDSDWRPEGLALAWDNGRFFASAMGTWLESDSNRGSEFAWTLEAGFQADLGDTAALRAGLGYHQFDVAGRRSFLGEGDFFGNSFNPLTETYLYDYHGLQAFAEIGFELLGRPAFAFFDYVQNQDADAHDTGYIVGAQLGNASAAGTWELAWAWEDLEADAALGLLVDSDFGGGGTDARGYIFSGAYAIRKNLKTQFTYFLNETGGDLAQERDFDRLMLDLSFKF